MHKCFEKCLSNFHDDKNHLGGTCKTNSFPGSSSEPSLQLLILQGPPANPGDSYHWGKTVWKHLAHNSFFSLTFCMLYVALVSQEKQKESRRKIQEPKKSSQHPWQLFLQYVQCRGVHCLLKSSFLQWNSSIGSKDKSLNCVGIYFFWSSVHCSCLIFGATWTKSAHSRIWPSFETLEEVSYLLLIFSLQAKYTKFLYPLLIIQDSFYSSHNFVTLLWGQCETTKFPLKMCFMTELDRMLYIFEWDKR